MGTFMVIAAYFYVVFLVGVDLKLYLVYIFIFGFISAVIAITQLVLQTCTCCGFYFLVKAMFPAEIHNVYKVYGGLLPAV